MSVLTLVVWLALSAAAHAQQPPDPEAEADEPAPQVGQSVSVDPTVSDEAIARRLTRILTAAGWFEGPTVRVDQGVAFLEGRVSVEERKIWAGDLARNTEGVVAVVNRITVAEASMWDLSPAWHEIEELTSGSVRRSPLILLALVLLVVTWIIATAVARTARSIIEQRFSNQLLQSVASRSAAIPVLLLGVYVVLRISGLTGLAATLLGGTGLIGLILGFAFRDIAENFLASLMISIQNPFATGDRIAVGGHDGFVHSVNIRSTILMTLDGNHVQIPNSVIYKETITNFTANPNTRFGFVVGIGYDASIEGAQATVRAVLRDQLGVVSDPEPWVIVENLGAATVHLRVYFWVDTSRFNGLKIRSAVIRAVKNAFEECGVSMPDEAREVVFPSGIQVNLTRQAPGAAEPAQQPERPAVQPPLTAADKQEPEGTLRSEAAEIEQQTQHARIPEQGPNLLEGG